MVHWPLHADAYGNLQHHHQSPSSAQPSFAHRVPHTLALYQGVKLLHNAECCLMHSVLVACATGDAPACSLASRIMSAKNKSVGCFPKAHLLQRVLSLGVGGVCIILLGFGEESAQHMK